MVLDASKEEEKNHRALLEHELELVGLRLNRQPPNITFKITQGGGVNFSTTVKLTKFGEDPAKEVYNILHEYRIHNANVLFREDCSPDDFIDVVEGNRKYVKCLYVYNKIDNIDIEDLDSLAHLPFSTVCSVHMNLNLDYLLEELWRSMGLIRVYTKPRGEPPDFTDPVVLSYSRNGITVEGACKQIHKDLVDKFNYAYVWGRSTKYNPQRVGINHILQDEDVIEIVTLTVQQERRSKNYNKKCQEVYDAYKLRKKKAALKT